MGARPCVYAVSKGHARNLEAIFYDAGISAAVIDSDTASEERTRVIDSFRDGILSVLINVEVVTEGFDLPDASCVVMGASNYEPDALLADGWQRSAT